MNKYHVHAISLCDYAQSPNLSESNKQVENVCCSLVFTQPNFPFALN